MNGVRTPAACLLAAAAFACVLPCAAQSAAAAVGAPPAPPSSHTVVIYRCTDAGGHVTLQNDVACPKGARQQRQVVDVPPAVPAYAPREDPPAPATAPTADERTATPADPASPSRDDAAAARIGSRRLVPTPPPALYACRTWDERDLLTEDATPAERCAPLRVVDAGGSARDDAAACEKVRDRCEAVPPEALCEAWRRRVDEAEFRWKFAGAHEGDTRHREFLALSATLARSDCKSR